MTIPLQPPVWTLEEAATRMYAQVMRIANGCTEAKAGNNEQLMALPAYIKSYFDTLAYIAPMGYATNDLGTAIASKFQRDWSDISAAYADFKAAIPDLATLIRSKAGEFSLAIAEDGSREIMSAPPETMTEIFAAIDVVLASFGE